MKDMKDMKDMNEIFTPPHYQVDLVFSTQSPSNLSRFSTSQSFYHNAPTFK